MDCLQLDPAARKPTPHLDKAQSDWLGGGDTWPQNSEILNIKVAKTQVQNKKAKFIQISVSKSQLFETLKSDFIKLGVQYSYLY